MPKKKEPDKCFVLAPIGKPDSDTRRRSDQVFRHVVTPVTQKMKLESLRADHIAKPGMITTQIIDHIMSDKIVIADLTDHNPNVFYELAIRHAIRKPLVQMIDSGQRIPFDVSDVRTIHFDIHDLDSVERCKKELEEQISAVIEDPSLVDNPISRTIELESLKASDDPADKTSVEIMSELRNIRGMVMDVMYRERRDIRHSPPEDADSVVSSLNALVQLVRTCDHDSLPEDFCGMIRMALDDVLKSVYDLIRGPGMTTKTRRLASRIMRMATDLH